METKLLNKLQSIGKLVEKKRARMEDIGVDEAVLVKGLSETKQAELMSLLNELQAYWAAAHKANHQKNNTK